jgi:hypothetical protein
MRFVQILIKKVPPVNGEVLVHLKNIESPAQEDFFFYPVLILPNII